MSDPADGMPFFSELARLLSGSGGPVNWELASQVAVKTLSEAGAADGRPDPHAVERAAQSMRLADLWLDEVTTLPSGVHTLVAWSRREWIDGTLPAWRAIIDPVASRVVAAVQEGLADSLRHLGSSGELPAELAGVLPPGLDLTGMLGQLGSPGAPDPGPLAAAMNQVSGLLFGGQVGQALGALAGTVAIGGDVGLPLLPTGTALLMPSGISARVASTDAPGDQVALHLALREAAWVRLLAGTPWLEGHLRAAVNDYASGIHVDPAALLRTFQSTVQGADPSADPSDPLSSPDVGLFGTGAPRTPSQQLALLRLENLLALVEGWICEVVQAAAGGRLPALPALQEATRRLRAEGGAAEQTFTALVGLELRPRRLREAATLWAALLESRGMEGRDAVWREPDLLPGSGDLDDPSVFVHGVVVPDDLEGLDES